MRRLLPWLMTGWILLISIQPVEALNVSLPKTWVTGDVLTASDLNNEFTTISNRSIDSTDMATTITWGATGNQYLDMSAITSSTTKGLRLPVGTGGTNAGQVSYDATSLWLRIGSGSVANFLPIISAQGSAGQVLMSQGANALATWVSSLAATSPSFTLTPTSGVAAGMHSELFGTTATDFYLKNGTRWILEEWPNALIIGGNSAAASATQIILKTTTTGDTALVLPANSVSLQGEVTGTLPVANGGTGATTLTSNGLLLGGGTGAITASAAPTNGQLLIGSTGAAPVLAALTAGSGITVTNGAGSITVAASATAGANGRVHRTAGDVTTTSGSLVDFTGATVTATTGANPVNVLWTATCNSSSVNGPVFFNVTVDGTNAQGTSGFLNSTNPDLNIYNDCSFAFQTAAQTAASHTFKMQWRSNGTATATTQCSSTTPCTFAISEAN